MRSKVIEPVMEFPRGESILEIQVLSANLRGRDQRYDLSSETAVEPVPNFEEVDSRERLFESHQWLKKSLLQFSWLLSQLL